MLTSINQFRKQISEKQLISASAKPKHGKMHQALGIPEDKEIKDVYTSGRKLAEDLVAKVGRKEAASMLAFVANINKEEDIYDRALRAVKNINESYAMDVDNGDIGDEYAKAVLDRALEDHRDTGEWNLVKAFKKIVDADAGLMPGDEGNIRASLQNILDILKDQIDFI
jgi:hypothetical protein